MTKDIWSRPFFRDGTWIVTMPILAWLGNALYAIGEPGGALKEYAPALVAGSLITFFVWHGRRLYSGPLLWRFVIGVFAVAWLVETLSIYTSVPFGRYHYTDIMAPFVGHVPVFVLPAYLLMGYCSWALALMLTGAAPDLRDRRTFVLVPLVAALLMVVWDLSMDPLRASVEGRWVWIDGGSYLGVPVSNYAGWFVTTWLMFASFALQVRRVAPVPARGAASRPAFWLAVPVAYASFAGEYLLNPFVAPVGASVATTQPGLTAADVFAQVAVISALTLLPLMALGLARAGRMPEVMRSARGVGRGRTAQSRSGRLSST